MQRGRTWHAHAGEAAITVGLPGTRLRGGRLARRVMARMVMFATIALIFTMLAGIRTVDGRTGVLDVICCRGGQPIGDAAVMQARLPAHSVHASGREEQKRPDRSRETQMSSSTKHRKINSSQWRLTLQDRKCSWSRQGSAPNGCYLRVLLAHASISSMTERERAHARSAGTRRALAQRRRA